MDKVNSIAAAASKAIWGNSEPGTVVEDGSRKETVGAETGTNTNTSLNETGGREPLSGKLGNVESGEPYDKGNVEPSPTTDSVDTTNTSLPHRSADATATKIPTFTSEASPSTAATTSAPTNTDSITAPSTSNSTSEPAFSPDTTVTGAVGGDDEPYKGTATSQSASGTGVSAPLGGSNLETKDTSANTNDTSSEAYKTPTPEVNNDAPRGVGAEVKTGIDTTDSTSASKTAAPEALKSDATDTTGTKTDADNSIATGTGSTVKISEPTGAYGSAGHMLKVLQEREDEKQGEGASEGGSHPQEMPMSAVRDGVDGDIERPSAPAAKNATDASSGASDDVNDASGGKEKLSFKDKVKAKLHKH